MRVLHLDAGREMRGGQWQVLALVQGLGSGNTLLAAAGGPLMAEAQRRGLDVQPLSMLSMATLAKSANLVHAHDARSHTWAAAVSTCPLVVSRRVAFPPGQSVLSRWKYGRARKYLAVSEHVRQTLINADVPPDRIEVVYDGVELPEKTANGNLIVAPAFDDPMKGSELVRAAADLAGVHVHFSSNLEADLPGAALLVYITRSEGLGSAALLAMAHGVPVVASRVGGLPEIVQHCETGILTDNDPPAIAEAMVRALSMREAMAAKARDCVQQKFSVQHMVERTRRVYEQIG